MNLLYQSIKNKKTYLVFHNINIYFINCLTCCSILSASYKHFLFACAFIIISNLYNIYKHFEFSTSHLPCGKSYSAPKYTGVRWETAPTCPNSPESRDPAWSAKGVASDPVDKSLSSLKGASRLGRQKVGGRISEENQWVWTPRNTTNTKTIMTFYLKSLCDFFVCT